jgi:hypothetical protein
MLKKFVKLVITETEQKIDDLRTSPYLQHADWELVQRRSGLGGIIQEANEKPEG